MKTVLVALLVAAILLVSYLSFWGTQQARTSALEIPTKDNPPVLDSAPMELEPAEEVVRDLELEPITRSEAEVPPAPEPVLEADMADRTGAARAEVFAKKYAGVSAADRAAAAEFIQLRLERDYLSAEAKVDLGHELEWLATHETP